MRKIAIVIFDITLRSGTERAVCNLANLLAERFAVSIISIHSVSGNAAYDMNSDIQLFHLGIPQSKNKIARLLPYYRVIKSIDRICREQNIDIVLGTTHAINSLLVFFRKKVKTVACEHLAYMAAPWSSRILRRILYPFLDAVVVLTSSDAKHYMFHKNVRIIPNSLPFLPDKYSDLTNKEILAVGRLTYQKGFDLLIDAISLIKNKCDGWRVKIVGSGEDENKLKKQIETLNLENIVRIYPSTNAIMQEYLSASIFVLSSRYEGFGLVLIEAQACGLPTVSFNCPEGPSEIVHHNEDGLLVENGNVEKMSEAILELIVDSNKRIQFGKKALQNIDRYKPNNVADQWNGLFSTL